MRCHCNIFIKLSLLLWVSPVAIVSSILDQNFIIHLSEPFLNASILQQMLCIFYSVFTLFIFNFVCEDEVQWGRTPPKQMVQNVKRSDCNSSKQMNDSDLKEPSSSHNYYKPEVTDFFKYRYIYLI